MQKISIKDTSLNFSKIGLGTGTGFNKILKKSQNDFFYAFDASIDNGINWIDTAESYANGYAEELIGKYSKVTKKKFFVTTKFSPTNASRKLLKQACEASLKRLNREHIDLYQIHWMNYSVPIEETIDTLISLKDEGKIRAIGLCNFSKKEISKCNTNLIVSNQIEFNLFNRIEEKTLLPFHHRKNLTTIAYSPFDGIKDLLPETKKKKVLDNLTSKYSASYFQIALSFLANYSNMVVVYSSTNAKHIIDNTNLIDIEKKDLELINKIFSSSVKLIDPKLIKILPNKFNKFYSSLNQAELNKYGYFPGIDELSKEFLISDNFKPVKVKKINDKHFKFELVGGMMRYWSWIKAHNGEKFILAVILNN